MKQKIWLLQIPFVVVFSSAFIITQLGVDGELHSKFLRSNLFPFLRTTHGAFTNAKFKIRGPNPPKNKIVIVEIDSPSIETIGRWPWHRDFMAFLIDKTFAAGAKVVGLDIVFSEEDKRVPDELAKTLSQQGMPGVAEKFETDPVLARLIQNYKDRLVLGWATESACQPAYQAFEDCPVTHPDAIGTHPEDMQNFAYDYFSKPNDFDQQSTPLMSIVTFIANIPSYNQAARYQGTFNIFPDPDGFVRRTSLVFMANGRPYPTLALQMAKVGLNEELIVELDHESKVKRLGFAKSGRNIPVSPVGSMEINFRGPSYHYSYVSALDIMGDDDKIMMGKNRSIAASKESVLKDAYVFIGLSAIGVFDMRAFPFDSNTPGVEGHANILDNLLSNDMLRTGSSGWGKIAILFLMIVGALAFAFFQQRLNSIPGLLLFLGVITTILIIDQLILFNTYNMNMNSSFLYIELAFIFIMTLAIKYVLEEKDKKFVKGAFSKYVSPKVVDQIMADPQKLTVGGTKKDLTILFSDIRSFTTFSERMDAKHLSAFLNDYLEIMTTIVIENQGTLDKYIGDAVMAFWGAPVDDPKHAYNACIASQQMMKALYAHQPRWKQEYGVDVSIGVGMNSGPVSVGNMGSQRVFAYTVIGDNVNLASRLEGLTKPYSSSILITRATMDYITQNQTLTPPEHRTLDHVKVKGKKQAVELIQILDREMNPEGLKLFEEGRKLYSEQKWDEAIAKFNAANEILRLSPDSPDGPSLMYIERCEQFKSSPPEQGWDGSWTMTSK